MYPSLAHFPDLCLEAIFKHVPLADLCRSIGLVCTNWYKLRTTELKKRRRLVIVQREDQLVNLNHHMLYRSYETDLMRYVRGDDGSLLFSLESLEQIKFDAVLIPDSMFDISSTSSLMFMTSVTHLTLILDDILSSTLIRVIRTIEHFSEHLIDLKLSLGFDQNSLNHNGPEEDSININHTNLFNSLSHLPSLEHLGLHQCFLNFIFDDPIEQLPFLPRLTTFSLLFEKERPYDGWVMPLLLPHLPMIDSWKTYNSMRLENLLEIDANLATKFTVLTLLGALVEDDMRLFCSRFSSLTKLKIKYVKMPMTMLARCLSQLPQLVHLDLKIFVDIPEVVEAQTDKEGKQPQPKIRQVLSVRMLSLYFITKSHHDTERFFIAEIFPNLQVLSLKHDLRECPDCAIRPLGRHSFHRIEDSNFPHQIAECNRLTREPFRRCLNLHTVALFDSDGTETLINVNEL